MPPQPARKTKCFSRAGSESKNLLTYHFPSWENMNRKFVFRLFASILITAGILWFILRQLNFNFKTLIGMISSISLLYLAAGFLVYLAITFLRALRFRILLSQKLGVARMFNITSIHLLLNFILPFRSGELSYVYLAKKTGLVSGSESLGSLIVARIFDVLALSLFSLSSVLLVSNLPPTITDANRIIAVFLAALILLIVLFLFTKERLIGLIRKVFIFLRVDRTAPVVYFLRKSEVIIAYMDVLKSWKKLFFVFVLSMLIWALLYLLAYIILSGLGVSIGFLKVVLGDTFLELSSILPFYTIGGFGIMEGAWALAFVSLGLSKDIAISSGFVYHLVLLVFIPAVSVFPLISYLRKQLG
jgi:glycosyltransferase 2 family protein